MYIERHVAIHMINSPAHLTPSPLCFLYVSAKSRKFRHVQCYSYSVNESHD